MKASFLMHYSSQVLFQEKNILANTTNELHDSSAMTWRKVCAAPKILFWLKLKAGFISCPNSLKISSTAQALREHSTGCRSLSKTVLLQKVGTLSLFPLSATCSHCRLIMCGGKAPIPDWKQTWQKEGFCQVDKSVSPPRGCTPWAELVRVRRQEHITQGSEGVPPLSVAAQYQVSLSHSCSPHSIWI